MRNIIVSEFVSLDGVMEDPAWTVPYWNDEIAKFKFNELFAMEALLLGRVTYQGFAEAWPSRTDPEGYANQMNSMPKYVVSKSLDSLKWNNSSLIKGNGMSEIKDLKKMPGLDILIFGSSTLVNDLVKHELVDRFYLLVYPVVIGKGMRVFEEGSKAKLKLVDTKQFGSGVVLLNYESKP